ncbi:hypothetical protein [Streptomyces sp. NBC_00096]|uniref:hypothetical protein n=1 Tax=Streptomyces sp. NBC_00096 TaxID=2975650 RepID=UPI003255B8F4
MSTFAFSRWEFLTDPLADVLAECSATIEYVAELGGFMGGIIADGQKLTVHLAEGLGQMEHDLVVRGLLAAWHDVDVTDWPVPMFVQGGQQ